MITAAAKVIRLIDLRVSVIRQIVTWFGFICKFFLEKVFVYVIVGRLSDFGVAQVKTK